MIVIIHVLALAPWAKQQPFILNICKFLNKLRKNIKI